MRWGLSALLIVCWTAVTPSPSPAQPAVQEIRHVSVRDYTRVIITLSDAVKHHHFRLAADPEQGKPPRIVADFSPARLGTAVQAPTSVRDGRIETIRTGQFSPTSARVVLDLQEVDSYTASAHFSPYRLIIDLKGRAADPVHKYRIMIDPGHGGRDPGAVGVKGLKEKTVVLAISKRLGKKLEARLPVEVLYTRTSDVFVPLMRRTARANAAEVDLFLSIHANASTNPRAQGVETYYLNNTNDRATLRLARMENGLGAMQAAVHDDPETSLLLSDLLQNQKAGPSIALANAIQDSMLPHISRRHAQVRNLGVKKGPFYVLVGAHMPCVLVEVSFLTHRVQGKLLRSAAYRDAIAEGIFEGVARFIRQDQRELEPL